MCIVSLLQAVPEGLCFRAVLAKTASSVQFVLCVGYWPFYTLFTALIGLDDSLQRKSVYIDCTWSDRIDLFWLIKPSKQLHFCNLTRTG